MSETKVVVMGSTGSGKSSLCNILAGMDCMGSETGGFPVSKKLSACTFQTTCRHVRWMGLGEQIMLIDTPGLDDPEGKDTEHIAEMVDKLMEVRHVNLFLIIFNAQRPRMDSSLRSMFRMFQTIFGSGFWANTAIIFSRWAFDRRSEMQREEDGVTSAKYEKMVNTFFRSNFNLSRNIPCVFVDSRYFPQDPGELEAFRRETRRLHDILMSMEPYECTDFEKVLSENDELRKKSKESEERRLEAEKKAKIFEKGNLEAERRWKVAGFESHPSLTTTDVYSKEANRKDPVKFTEIDSNTYAASWQTFQAREFFLQHCQCYSLVCEQLKKSPEIMNPSSIAEEPSQQQVIESLREAIFDDMKEMQNLQVWLSLSSKCNQDKNLQKMVELAQPIWNIKIQAVKELFDSQFEVNLRAVRIAIERLLEFFCGQRMLDILNKETEDGETNLRENYFICTYL